MSAIPFEGLVFEPQGLQPTAFPEGFEPEEPRLGKGERGPEEHATRQRPRLLVSI